MSYLSLSLPSFTFTITKAHIKESLESLWRIECEGYIESLEENPFALDSFASLKNKNNPTSALNFHPNALINKQATFRISNPYPQTHNTSKTLDFTNNPALKSLKDNIKSKNKHKENKDSITSLSSLEKVKEYQGVLSFVEYLGLNPQSSANVFHRGNLTPSLNHKHFFKLTLCSSLYRMSLNKANRIYTDKSVIEVIHSTLNFYTHDLIKPLDFSAITLTYPKLELISQYQESDLDFITRLAHNNGIYFCDVAGSICFYDTAQRHSSRELTFNPNVNNTLNEPCISSVKKLQSLRANFFTQSSENTLNPFALQSLSLKSDSLQQEVEQDSLMHSFNEHHYVGEFSFTQKSDLKTPLTLKEKRLRVLEQSLSAQSNIYDLTLNEWVRLNFSSNLEENKENLRDFIIIEMEQVLTNEALLENNFNSNDNAIKKENAKHLKGSESLNTLTQSALNALKSTPEKSKSYVNTLTLLPLPFSYTPSLKSKPKAPNSTLGVVIGEDEDIESKRNTIHTDEYGRVRVRINCFANQEVIDNARTKEQRNAQGNNAENNHYNTNNTQANHPLTQENHTTNNDVDSNNSQTKAYSYHYSPYLRVSSPIASASSGFYHTPRVGDEVIVSFFDEDIDKPYISGSLYNQSNPALPPLPLNAHQTSLSARTLNNSSALQAENTNSHHNLIESGFNEITLSNLKEQEHIYLQAQRDYEELIKHNFTQTIHNNKESQVEGTYNERIKKIHTQTIDLAKIVSIGGEYNTNVALSKDTIVGLSHTLNVGVDNKVRIAKKSSEYVGEDKEVEIGGNLNTSIKQDESRNVGGNKREVVEGDKQEHIEGNLNITSQSQGNIYTQKGLYVESQTLSFQAKDVTNMESDSVGIDAQSDCAIQAGNQILHQVGDTSITAKGDSVIIKAGGVEVVIDSKGLVVKGGEVKSE
ncbi:contractile injection system protein, VgrG/Pvc8 family [Helicobacter typhlonius]|uniref:type VI secretion system Vgr family protein n=1 Tax=Helicobacter typhlonius TaxID=76936 RepID=UPI002FE077AA